VVEDTAEAHGSQGLLNHRQSGFLLGSAPISQQEKQVMRRGKLWSATKSAVLLVKA
jgi:hypothetical protein